MNVQMAFVLLGSMADRVSKFDWMRLIPKFRVDKYKYGVVGIEFTMPWKREGLGVGLGLGTIDLWFGWPSLEEDLHTGTCHHEPIAQPVDS